MSDDQNYQIKTSQLRKSHGFADPQEQGRFYDEAHAGLELAKDILKLSRNTLLINLRFLELAFMNLIPRPDIVATQLATDGLYLFYNFAYICRSFQKSPALPARDFLHVVLHCLFRHLFVSPRINQSFWDLAADIAVENIITTLRIQSLYAQREEKQNWLISKLTEKLPRLNAESIYRYLLDQKTPPEECDRIREPFYVDDHFIWHSQPELTNGGKNEPASEEDPSDSDLDNGSDETGQTETSPPPEDQDNDGNLAPLTGAEVVKAGTEGESGSGGGENHETGDQKALTPQELEQIWKNIS
ncbi:MAG: hypothetical protein LBF97_07955, partial [Elusimicrobiota bacterium]|nr:hypothetical protein [Elusimicrobiota bacterium]